MKSNSKTDDFNLLKEITIFDKNKNQINAAETDWLVIRGAVLRDIFCCINIKLGANGKALLEEIGAVVGRNFAIEQLDNKMRPDEVLTILGLLFN